MIAYPTYSIPSIDSNSPLAVGMDFAMVVEGSFYPRNLKTNEFMTPRGNFATGGSGSVANVSINEAGQSFYTNASAGTTDKFDIVVNSQYTQDQSALVIGKFDTITGALFPRTMMIDAYSSSNAINMFGRHTTNVIIIQVALNGVFTNFTTSSAAIIPGTVQALGWTLTAQVSGSSPTVYVDGRPAASTGTVLGSALTTSASGRIYIQNDAANTANMMQGHIFAAFHWTRKLSETEMQWMTQNWKKLVRRQ